MTGKGEYLVHHQDQVMSLDTSDEWTHKPRRTQEDRNEDKRVQNKQEE